MAVNVFNTSNDAKKPILIKAGRAKLKVEGVTESMLAMNCTVQFSRSVEVVPVIGDQRVLSVGEPTGTCSIGTILAKSDSTLEKILGKETECEGFTMQLTFTGDATCGMGGRSVTLGGCIASAVSIEMQGGRGFVASSVQITFTSLQIGEGSGSSGVISGIVSGVRSALGI